MSLVALRWMLYHAEENGLRLHESLRQEFSRDASVHGNLYDSRAGLAAYYRYHPRRIDRICDENHAPIRIHASVIERIDEQTEGYAPTAITGENIVVVKEPDSSKTDSKETDPLQTDSGPTNLSETDEEKTERLDKFDEKTRRLGKLDDAHDFIFLNQGTYILHVAWSLALVLLGVKFYQSHLAEDGTVLPGDATVLPADATLAALRNALGSVEQPLLDLAQSFVPGFVAPVLQGYWYVPGALSGMLVLYGVLLYVNRSILDLSRDAATRAWHGATPDAASTETTLILGVWWRLWRTIGGLQRGLLRWLAKRGGPLHRSERTRRAYQFWRMKVMPAIVWALILVVVAYLLVLLVEKLDLFGFSSGSA